MEKEFFQKDVMKALNVTKTCLEQWLGYGFIRPSIREADGKGSRNIFSLENLLTIALFKELVEGGLSRKEAANEVNRFFMPDKLSEPIVKMVDEFLKEYEKNPLAWLYFAYIRKAGGDLEMMILTRSEHFITLAKTLRKNLSKKCLIINFMQMTSEVLSKAGVDWPRLKKGETLLTGRRSD